MSRIFQAARKTIGRLRKMIPGVRFPVPWFLCLPRQPVSSQFAFDRGQPIDRFYIESFLRCNQSDIRGRVLEIGDRAYTVKFGGSNVSRSDVLHAVDGNPDATLVGDLATGEGLDTAVYDCAILTQTLHVIYDIHAAAKHIHRILKPGGVVLATIPGITQISRYDADRWGDFWRMTPVAVRRLLEEIFPSDKIQVWSYGNVRSATAFLYGLSVQDVPPSVLESLDPDYPVLISVRAIKE